jgi:hypothetical protein
VLALHARERESALELALAFECGHAREHLVHVQLGLVLDLPEQIAERVRAATGYRQQLSEHLHGFAIPTLADLAADVAAERLVGRRSEDVLTALAHARLRLGICAAQLAASLLRQILGAHDARTRRRLLDPVAPAPAQLIAQRPLLTGIVIEAIDQVIELAIGAPLIEILQRIDDPELGPLVRRLPFGDGRTQLPQLGRVDAAFALSAVELHLSGVDVPTDE